MSMSMSSGSRIHSGIPSSSSASSPGSLAPNLPLGGSGMRLGLPWWGFPAAACPFLRLLFLAAAGGMLLTANEGGNLSSYGTLLGLETSVHSWSAGKNGMLLSGFLSSMKAHRLMKSGHALSQLACALDRQDTQWRLSLLVQLDVRCLSPHVPHVSSISRHLSAKCPHRLHFIHWVGSCFSFDGLIRLLQIPKPSLISLLAMSTEVMVRTA